MAEPLRLLAPEDHPKLQASSSLVKSACAAICQMLGAEGFCLVPIAGRDGFILEHPDGGRFGIDPKGEALRINIGRRPAISPPPELVHPGRQREWIEVRPPHTQIALQYLDYLARAGRS
jgi:hypothetical protein